MKRTVAFFLVTAFVFSFFVGTVSAETENMIAVESKSELLDLKPENPRGGFVPDKPVGADKFDTYSENAVELMSVPEQDVYDFLAEQMKNRVPTIRLYPTYKIPVYLENDAYNIEGFHTILRTVLFNNYDIFVYDDAFDCQIKTVYGRAYIDTFSPDYYTPSEGDAQARQMMENQINAYIAAVSDIPSNDVVGKMLVIHDLLCANNMYDSDAIYDEANNNIKRNDSRTAYYMFTNNRGVCQAYAIVLKAIYDKLNEQLKIERGTDENIIETVLCSSDLVQHIWDVVKIDGKWYHLDPTWDDIDFDKEGNLIITAHHGYFLKTDDEFIVNHLAYRTETEYIYDWVFYTDESVVCDDDKYLQGYIFNYNYAYLVSYSDGGYNLDFGHILRTTGIIATEILATDTFLYEYEEKIYNAVVLFTDGPTAIRQLTTYHDASGMLTRCYMHDDSIGEYYNFTILLYADDSDIRLFIWSPTNFEPLCRALDIPALDQ